jgi:hypothetical protein
MPNRPLRFQWWRRKGPPVLQRSLLLHMQFQGVQVEGAAAAIGVASASSSATVRRSGAGSAIGVARGIATADPGIQTIPQGGGGRHHLPPRRRPWVILPARAVLGQAHAFCSVAGEADGSVIQGGEGRAHVQLRTKATGRASPGQILDEDELFLILDIIDYPGREMN